MEVEGDLEEWESPPTPTNESVKGELRIAMVCHSNVNRSMEAHDLALRKGFIVDSYGIGKQVKLPGLTIENPNVFEFGTSYEDMFQSLATQDRDRYIKNGMLHMLDRDRKVKRHAERFQESPERYHLVICFEQRVFDAVMEDLQSREVSTTRWTEDLSIVHVVNIETVDNHRAAKVGAERALELIERLYEVMPDWEGKLDDILDRMEEKYGIHVQHTAMTY